MSAPRLALWRGRTLRLAISGGASAVGAIGSLARNKWLALHLETTGLGVLGQVFAAQVWLGTATGLGLGLPVAQQVGEALGRGDRDAVRRTVSTAIAILASTSLSVALIGWFAAPGISAALFGSPEYAPLVRVSMVAVAGLAFQPTVQGLFAGYSDIRATLVYALLGNTAAVTLVLLLVPRFGLVGAVWSMAAFWPVAILGTLWLERRTYATVLGRPRFDRGIAVAMLQVAAAALLLALLDQGALLAVRAHYVRSSGIAANGLFQAALALSQQLGAVFYAYLGGYAFGRISGVPDLEGIRAYTLRQFVPLVGLAWLAFAVAMVAAGPLLHLFYSSRFDGARPMVGWMLVGEFAKVSMQTWALGALPLGGVRLWVPIGVTGAAGTVLAYPVARSLGAGDLSLPFAYASAGVLSLAFATLWMALRGVSMRVREAGLVVGGTVALAILAKAIAR